ncbi:MAG TPA: Nif11-like leader peptide family natural product precursor [Acidimicrobiales bacterium]|jgi:predicted ribosomally synthesized peptide with nif11-like leader
MSAEGVTALYERVNSDEEFRDRLEAAETPDDKRQMVTEAGYEVSRDDLPTIRKLSGVTELSDEDLDTMAGGLDTLAAGGAFFGSLGLGLAAASAWV